MLAEELVIVVPLMGNLEYAEMERQVQLLSQIVPDRQLTVEGCIYLILLQWYLGPSYERQLAVPGFILLLSLYASSYLFLHSCRSWCSQL